MKEDYIEMLEDYLKLELGDEQVLGLNSFAVNNILNIIKNLDKEIERLKEELEFEKATNKELISTGAELENKLYEEQDKNKRLKKELQEEIEEKEHYQAIVESWE